MDITYIPMTRGFVYLAVVLDWFSRRMLSWGISITMEAAFCVETLEDALARHGKPEIFNTDQGSQFTSAAFTGVLIENGITISMDGKGAWRDNVFVERLWRSVKYEEVYLRAYGSVSDARASIGCYPDFYNHRRPHSSFDGATPDHAYFTPLPSAWQSNPGRRSTYRRGKDVQTTGSSPSASIAAVISCSAGARAIDGAVLIRTVASSGLCQWSSMRSVNSTLPPTDFAYPVSAVPISCGDAPL
jgi:hypothetical protein